MPTLSILIVNYNGLKFLPACLDSIARQVQCDHEVIVVDNASSDGSRELLSAKYPNVRLICNPTNAGFAGGNNLGAKNANGKYLLLLNHDTVLLNDLSPAIQLFESDTEIGIVTAKMMDSNNEWRSSTGWYPSPIRLLKFSLLLQSPQYLTNAVREKTHCRVDWAQGSFLLMRLEAYKELGGLDEGYFMYVEDVDFCKRAADIGLVTVFYPGVAYLHFGGFEPARWFRLYDGFKRYHQKFSSWPVRVAANFVLGIGKAARIAVYGAKLGPRNTGLGTQ
jgi:GT2 family glycosyltransferase